VGGTHSEITLITGAILAVGGGRARVNKREESPLIRGG